MDHLFVYILMFSFIIQTVQACQVKCADKHYGDKCNECPHNCLDCVSKVNCTQCDGGYYGLICDKQCEEECPRSCHKVYGFCTHGCPDGQYSTPNDRTCRNCTENCEICQSLSVCFHCTDGKYGKICQYTCPAEHCIRCEISNGQCLQCNNSFFLEDGQCKSCPCGCRICNTTNNCLSCEIEFFGPTNGSCLFKCPANDMSINTVYNKKDRCRIVQDTDINTCDGRSVMYTCSTSGYCLQNATCPTSVKCAEDSNELTLCSVDMQYTCEHECQKVYSFLVCNTTCSVRKKDSGNAIPFCLADDILSLIVESFKEIYNVVCNRTEAILETKRCPYGYMIDNVCHKCPDNCLECVSDINCTFCKDGFYGSICENPCKEKCPRSCHMVNGDCPHGCSDGKFVDADGQCKSCPYGCRLCNTSNSCLSCEEEFFGPTNGYCLFKCPVNDTPTYTNYVKNDPCRIVKDTNISTCDGHSDRYACKTSGYCLKKAKCFKTVKCAGTYELTSCAVDMQYTCHHECKTVYIFLVCNTTCSVRKKESGNDIPFCVGEDSLSRIVESFKKTYQVDCSQTEDTIEKTQMNDTYLSPYAYIAAVLLLLLIIIIIGIILTKNKYWTTVTGKKPASSGFGNTGKNEETRDMLH